MSNQDYPPGWDEKRIRAVIDHYESQTDDEAIAEDEATMKEVTAPVDDARTALRPVSDSQG